jgi:hypothetical protein
MKTGKLNLCIFVPRRHPYYEDGFPSYQHVSIGAGKPNHLRRRREAPLNPIKDETTLKITNIVMPIRTSRRMPAQKLVRGASRLPGSDFPVHGPQRERRHRALPAPAANQLKVLEWFGGLFPVAR